MKGLLLAFGKPKGSDKPKAEDEEKDESDAESDDGEDMRAAKIDALKAFAEALEAKDWDVALDSLEELQSLCGDYE